MHSAGTGLCAIIARDFVCQHRDPGSCARDNFYPINGNLITFSIAMIVHFLGNSEVITGYFFTLIFTERVERCEEDGLSSILVLFPSCNESVLKDGLNAEGTTPVKHNLFPIFGNFNVPHQFRRNCYSTRVSLNW